MPAIRYLALAALVVWLGGMIVLGLLVEPAASPAVSGDILREFHLVAYACATSVILSLLILKFVGPPPRGFIPRLAIVVMMLAVEVMSGTLMTRDETRRLLFGVNAVLGLVALGWYVRE